MLFQRMAIRTAALVLFASCLTARAAAPVFTYGIYGVLNPEGKTSKEKYKDMQDVTSKIKELISSKKARSEYKDSINGIFAKDPIRNKVKTLHVVIGLMDEREIDEYDMNAFWDFIAGERAKKPR